MRFSEVFRPGVRFALLIAVTLAVLQQWTGVSVLSAYLPKICQTAGYERIADAVWLSVLTYIFNLAMTAVALWWTRRGADPCCWWARPAWSSVCFVWD